MPGFFERLNYSSVNEDWRCEAQALRLGPTDDVLCVTGSGDRPLDLLMLEPRRVVAIDLAPAQNHLLELKAAALRSLSFPDYASFLGLSPGSAASRCATLAALEAELSAAALAYWQRNRRLVERGVLYEGGFERFFASLARLARLVRGRAVRELLSFRDLEQQRRFLRERWDRSAWRAVYRLLLSRPLMRLLFQDPAFYERVAVVTGTYLYDRMLAHLGRVLARESFMVSLALQGRLPEGDLPPYLTPEGAAVIRQRLDRLSIVTADLVEHLHSVPPGTYSAFSLSDTPSYLPQEGFERLMGGMIRAGSPGARFCVRLFLTRPWIPPTLASRLSREPALETRLAEEDHSFAYDFIVGRTA